MVRVSDRAAFASSDQFLRNAYAKMQPWNADGSRLLLSYSKTGYVLDGKTYRLLGRVPLNSIGDAVWSNTDRDAIYRSEGNALVRVTASTGAVTRLATFAGFSSVVVGGGEGSPSNDDHYLALLGRSAAGDSALVYDLSAGRLVGQRLLGPTGSVDWVAMSQSGAASSWPSFFADGPGTQQGVAVFDRTMRPVRHLTDSSEHADLGRTAAGQDVYVTVDYNGAYRTCPLLSRGRAARRPWRCRRRGVGTHVSCRNTSRPGWCYLSDTAVDRPHRARFRDGPRVHPRRLAARRTPFAHEYQSQRRPTMGPVPSPSSKRTGDRVLFGSDWLGGPAAPGYAYVPEPFPDPRATAGPEQPLSFAGLPGGRPDGFRWREGAACAGDPGGWASLCWAWC